MFKKNTSIQSLTQTKFSSCGFLFLREYYLSLLLCVHVSVWNCIRVLRARPCTMRLSLKMDKSISLGAAADKCAHDAERALTNGRRQGDKAATATLTNERAPSPAQTLWPLEAQHTLASASDKIFATRFASHVRRVRPPHSTHDLPGQLARFLHLTACSNIIYSSRRLES